MPAESREAIPSRAAAAGRAAQRLWAQGAGIAFDAKGYTHEIRANLFQPMSEATLRELGAGLGSELDGKIRALHSSAALVANVFEYWRERAPMAPVAQALGLTGEIRSLRFESHHRLPVGSFGPHLDVEFATAGRPVAVESKFLEPYGPPKKLKSYYARPATWTPWNLTPCADLALAIQSGQLVFHSFDAAQVLAHILGLSRTYGASDYRLLYLWYEIPGAEADRHREEVAVFKARLGGAVPFEAISWQQVFEGLVAACGGTGATGHANYLNWLRNRYFGPPVEASGL